MERKHVPEAENRLLILYALRRLGPVTAMQLLQFLVDENLMNYFTMQLSLSAMEEQGQISLRPHPLDRLLELTPDGEYAMETFAHRVPVSRRRIIDQAAPAWRERFRAEQMAPAEALTMQDGSVCLRLRLLEGADALMEVLLTLPEAMAPHFLQQRWRNAAQAVYRAVTLSLSEGFDPLDDPPQPPDSASIQQTAAKEWLLSLTDDPDRSSIALLLSLSDERLACYCAAHWPERRLALREMMLHELGVECGDGRGLQK